MSQDPKIMSAALRRFQADRDARRNALEARRREVYRRAPRVELIDRELSGTAAGPGGGAQGAGKAESRPPAGALGAPGGGGVPL